MKDHRTEWHTSLRRREERLGRVGEQLRWHWHAEEGPDEGSGDVVKRADGAGPVSMWGRGSEVEGCLGDGAESPGGGQTQG